MLQRIQSIYLLLSFLGALLMFFIPIADLTFPDGNELYVYIEREVYLMILAGAVAALSLINIFLYKKRNIQVIIGFLALVLTAIFMFSIILNVEMTSEESTTGVEGSYTWGTFVPFLIIIFTSLALRNIRKDEMLVRSMDRLR